MKRMVCVFVALFSVAMVLPKANAQHPDSIETLKNAVVKINTYDNAGHPKGEGTGIVIGKKGGYVFILTAFHVIERSVRQEVRFYQWQFEPFEADIYEQFDNDLDVGIVAVKLLSEHEELYTSFSTLQRRNPSQVDVLRHVLSIGHPFGNSWQVTSSNQILDLDYEGDSRKMTVTKIAIDRGCSGGPLFDTQQNLLGMFTAIDSVRAIAVEVGSIVDLLTYLGIPTNLILVSSVRVTPTSPPTPLPDSTIAGISTSRNDFRNDYATFNTGRLFLNLKMRQPIQTLLVDWGENEGDFRTIENLRDLEETIREEDGIWYTYSVEYHYKSLGIKVIHVRAQFEDESEYQITKQITINVH